MFESDILSKIVNALKNYQLACFPTETVYALAGKADNASVIKKIYSIKNRAHNKPLSVFVKNLQQISTFTNLTENQTKIINYFSPGAVTFILPIHNHHSLEKSFFNDTIGVRVPNHPLALAILNHCDAPLVVTSVNISGNASVIKAHDIPDIIKKNVSIIIKDDSLVRGIESTVIDLTSSKIKILREGAVLESEIFSVLEKL